VTVGFFTRYWPLPTYHYPFPAPLCFSATTPGGQAFCLALLQRGCRSGAAADVLSLHSANYRTILPTANIPTYLRYLRDASSRSLIHRFAFTPHSFHLQYAATRRLPRHLDACSAGAPLPLALRFRCACCLWLVTPLTADCLVVTVRWSCTFMTPDANTDGSETPTVHSSPISPLRAADACLPTIGTCARLPPVAAHHIVAGHVTLRLPPPPSPPPLPKPTLLSFLSNTGLLPVAFWYFASGGRCRCCSTRT